MYYYPNTQATTAKLSVASATFAAKTVPVGEIDATTVPAEFFHSCKFALWLATPLTVRGTVEAPVLRTIPPPDSFKY
jgi:hypothetical protein